MSDYYQLEKSPNPPPLRFFFSGSLTSASCARFVFPLDPPARYIPTPAPTELFSALFLDASAFFLSRSSPNQDVRSASRSMRERSLRSCSVWFCDLAASRLASLVR